jgi:hypothetical protein
MGQLLVVRRTIAMVAALFFVDAGINADLHMFGFAMAALSVLLALPIVFPTRSDG